MSSLFSWIDPLRRAVTHPVEELNRWQRSVRYFVELMGHCWRQLNEDRAEEMAAALTYRTIFSLIPLVVLGLVVFRIFGGFEVVQQRVLPAAYGFFGVPEVSEEYGASTQGAASDASTQALPGAGEGAVDQAQAAQAEAERREETQQVRGVIQQTINDLIGKVSELSFTSIGVVGIVVFIYAAMTLALAVEYDFNIIFKAPTGRPWHLRLPVYWSLLTLGSGLLGVSLYLTGKVIEEVSEFHLDFGEQQFYLAPALVGLLGRLLAFMASWGFIFLLYTVIPSTRVRWRPALLGSFVAALLWECAKVGFQLYVNRALPYAELYGALGLIPLFLFWVYISWLIVLFGLELTYAQQMMRGNRYKLQKAARESDTLLDPRWVIPVMASIGEAFAEGKTVTAEGLASRLMLPLRAVCQLVDQLQSAGLLHRVEEGHSEDDPGYSLAVPPDRVTVSRLLELGTSLSLREPSLRNLPGRELLAGLSAAEHQAANGETLATLLARNGEGRGA